MAIFTPIEWQAGDVITAAYMNRLETGLSAVEAAKQDILNWDTTPKSDSTNPVTSGGLYSEFAALRQLINQSGGGSGGGSGLPAVTSADEGKFLMVNSSGIWAATSLAIAEENVF